MTAESSRSPSREQALGKKSEDDIDSEKGLKRRKLDNHNVKTGQSASSHSDSDVIKLKVASRKSPLALWQTNHVIQLLQNKKNFKLEFEIVEQATIGDKVLDKHLSVLGKEEVTKAQNQATVSSCGSVSSSSSTGIAAATTAPTASGLFTKELELQLLSNEADFAVHSLKDMPTRLPEGLSLVCIPERADESDCVVVAPKWRQQGVQSLEELWKLKKKQQSVQSKNQSQCQPNLALVIGSSSLRRESLLKRYFNNSFKCNTKLKQDSESQSDSEMRNIQVETIRGNVQTRLRKLEEPKEGDVQYDCIILASIGLERVELGHKIEFALPMTKEDDWEQRSLDVMLSSTKKSNSSNSESKLVPESDSDSNVKSTVKSGLAFPYCVSQGALGIECRTNDIQTINILKQIACPEATLRCSAERGLLNALDGGCQISMGVMSEIKFQFSNCRNMFYLETIILSRDGKEEVSGRIEEDVSDIITGWRDKLDDQYYPQIQDHNDKDAESDNRNPATDNISKIDEITKLGDEIGRELARKLKNDDPKISAIIKRLTTDVTDAELRDSAENNVRQISRPITYGSAETAGIVTEGFKEKTQI